MILATCRRQWAGIFNRRRHAAARMAAPRILTNALAEIRRGMPLEQAHQIYGPIRHPDDVAELEAAAELGVVDRTPAGNLTNALAEIRRGMPLEQAHQIYGPIRHPDDVAELEAAAASRAASA